MVMLSQSLVPLLLTLPTTLASFYDNPEVEIPPETGSPLEELKAKWDFDVSLFLLAQSPFRIPITSLQPKSLPRPNIPEKGPYVKHPYEFYSGDSQASQHSLISSM